MEKNIKLTILYDIYGKLLTEKQRQIFELYYISDLSLREIAQNLDISYQAVRDSIKSSEHMLSMFEDVIGMQNIKLEIADVISMCDSIKDDNLRNKIIKKLSKI